MRLPLLALLCVLSCAPVAGAQLRVPSNPAGSTSDVPLPASYGRTDAARIPLLVLPVTEPAGPVGMLPVAAGGILGGALGLVGGAYVGAQLRGDCIDECIPVEPILGALVGEIIGVAAGSHLANLRQGSLTADLLVSTVSLAAGLAVAGKIGSGTLFLAVPVFQTLAVAATERNPKRP